LRATSELARDGHQWYNPRNHARTNALCRWERVGVREKRERNS
jgi:hypothetical protein